MLLYASCGLPTVCAVPRRHTLLGVLRLVAATHAAPERFCLSYFAFRCISQMPYEAISEEQYKSQTAKLRKLDFKRWQERPREGGGGREGRIEEVPDKFCETDACTTSVSTHTGGERERTHSDSTPSIYQLVNQPIDQYLVYVTAVQHCFALLPLPVREFIKYMDAITGSTSGTCSSLDGDNGARRHYALNE